MAYTWEPVKSSAVTALCFEETGRIPLRQDAGMDDPIYGELLIAYTNGSVYRYAPMVRAAYEALLYAESVGRALNRVLPRRSGEFVGKRRG